MPAASSSPLFVHGRVTCYPTDTAYGLGVRCDDPAGLQQLFTLKSRPLHKPVSLMVRDFTQLAHYAHVPGDLAQWWAAHAHHPLTVLLRPRPTLPTSWAWPSDRVGFRVCPVPRLCPHLTVPVTATSANPSGQPPAYTLAAARAYFGDHVHYAPHTPDLTAGAISHIYDHTTHPVTRLR